MRLFRFMHSSVIFNETSRFLHPPRGSERVNQRTRSWLAFRGNWAPTWLGREELHVHSAEGSSGVHGLEKLRYSRGDVATMMS